jgi:N-acetyl-alpha-D-muramate 1-phosphate uridylyltransferase
MILAAGRGERMRPLTDTTAKPLLAVGGKPLIQYHLENLASAGVREVVINLAWHGAKIRDAFGDGTPFGVKISYSDEGDAALETGGGICKALPLLGDAPFIVVSGDVWTEFPLSSLTLASSDVAHFVVVPNPDFHTRGDFGLANGRMTETGTRYTYANIGVFTRAFFAGRKPEKFALAPLMFDWIRKERVSGELFEGAWHNVGTPAQLAALDRELVGRRTDLE